MQFCVCTISYSFVVNDFLVGPILSKCGLRQGDPLSPYLFILCAKGMSSLLKGANRRGEIHGDQVHRRAPSISHLLFADDSLLFYHSFDQECQALNSTLNLHERASRQAINYGKSGIFFSDNVDHDIRQRLKEILGVIASLNTGRYLGLPSLIGRGKREIFQFIRERLWTKLQFWRNKKLSKAGKKGFD